MQKSRTPLVGALGYQRFLLSKPVVSRKIALHVVPADRASDHLVCAFPIYSHFNFIFGNFSRSSTVLNSESDILLVVVMHFVPRYDIRG